MALTRQSLTIGLCSLLLLVSLACDSEAPSGLDLGWIEYPEAKRVDQVAG